MASNMSSHEEENKYCHLSSKSLITRANRRIDDIDRYPDESRFNQGRLCVLVPDSTLAELLILVFSEQESMTLKITLFSVIYI